MDYTRPIAFQSIDGKTEIIAWVESGIVSIKISGIQGASNFTIEAFKQWCDEIIR